MGVCMNIKHGVKRLVWVVSILGLIETIVALGFAGSWYFEQLRVMQPFIEAIDEWESAAIETQFSVGDAEKGRAYLAHQFVQETLGKTVSHPSGPHPSGRDGDSKQAAMQYVRRHIENRWTYNWKDAIGFAFIGVGWFLALWILYGVINWVIKGFKS